jgi:hypothetical protein
MHLDLANLPSDPTLLQRLVRDMAEAVERRDGEIERLQSIIKALQRAEFGRRSERLEPDQLALAFEDIEADIGRIEGRGAGPCPRICLARMSASSPTRISATAAAVPCTRSVRASPRCSIGSRRSCG